MEAKIALLHRHTEDTIKQTNAAFPYLVNRGVDVLTFKKFNRLSGLGKLFKSFIWIFYAPVLVRGKGYDVIYCDDSFPYYAGLVKLVCPKSKVILRLGDFHLMYYFSGWMYKLAHIPELWSWRKVDRIIAISKTMADHIKKEVSTPVDTVLDPVDPKDFKCDEEVKKERKVISFHGTLTKNKNIDMIFEAAKRMPKYDFVILGSGPEYKRLLQIAPSNVYMPGWIPFDKIKYHLNIADVGVAMRGKNPGNEFVVTSPWLQYLVMGKPCIVSKRKVFDDIGYTHYFESLDDLIIEIKYLLAVKGVGERWKDYILRNHQARKIAYQIWEILTKK
tara:strand:- start:363 stop:1358 length:996 start_codon:yes stop_codon:yes gene_type:complete